MVKVVDSKVQSFLILKWVTLMSFYKVKTIPPVHFACTLFTSSLSPISLPICACSSSSVGCLDTVMEEQKGELKQLEEMKVKTANEVCSIKEKIARLEAENYRLGRLDELRTKSEMKCEVCDLSLIVTLSC